MKKPHRKELVRPLPRVDVSAARPVARLEERRAVRYPSLAMVSMDALNALLDEALRAVGRPAMVGAVGLAMLTSGCQEAQDAPPAATLAPLGETQDSSAHDAPGSLALPGAGGWGSLAGGGAMAGTGTPTAGVGSGSTPCDPSSAEPDSGVAPCDPGLATDVDGGVDAGRHVTPPHHPPQLRGRMPSTQRIRTAGVPMRVSPPTSGGAGS